MAENVNERLSDLHCVTVPRDTPHLTDAEIAELAPQAPKWEVSAPDGEARLERVFKLKNFQESMALAARIGEIAEAEDHHPALLVEWGKLTVTWWTHSIKGLHKNDFIMAAKTDQLL